MKQGIVICYSRTGYTATLAKEVADMTGWDLVQINDLHPREGNWGQFRCALDVILHRHPRIVTYDRPIGGYKVVVLAAPVWLRSLASPMRSYVAQHRGHFQSIAHLCTYGGQGAEQAARQAAKLAKAPLVASLAVTSQELEQGDYRRRLDDFLNQLNVYRIRP